MTETQAKSGSTGTSMNPVTRDDLDGGAEAMGDHAGGADHVVGRASVAPGGTSKNSQDQSNSAGGSGDAVGTARPVSATASAPVTSAAPSMPTSASAKATTDGSENSPKGVSARPGDRQPGATEAGRAVAGASRVSTDVKPTGKAGVVTPDKPPAVGRSAAAPAAGAPTTGAARVADAVRSARATVTGAAQRGPRRARLFVKRVDPWSVMKFAFALSFVLFFVLIVATAVLYLALDSMHVFTSVNKAIADLVPGNKDVKITAGVVIGSAGALGLVMVVLCTALSTLAAFIYNVCADLVGGIEVTLSEKE